jgi:NADH-quinone oxidoreductase subunit C
MGRLEIGMGPKEAAEVLAKAFPSEIREIAEFQGQVSITVSKDRIRDIMRFLHDDPALEFHFLTDICGVDYLDKKETRFEVVYILFSLPNKIALSIKAQVAADDPRIYSVVSVWAGANWRERECFDMFGISFSGHPDLRRLLMPEDWDGYPLCKDYPLQSDLGEREWQGYKDVIETAERNKGYGVR